jgi:penicillin amidase
MRITESTRSFEIAGTPVAMRRTPEGVMEMWAEDDLGLAAALGFAHAADRMLQMMLVRLIGQGRVSECLRSDDASLVLDRFAREMGFAADARSDTSSVGGDARRLGANYCAGVNHYLEHYGYPWELRLVRYRPEPWALADTLATIQLMSYLALAQSQQDAEKLIIQALQSGVDLERLKRLFAPHLDGLTDELRELVQKTPVHQPLVPPEVKFLTSLPKVMASNNWVVAGRKTASGLPIQCNDPHLECNRLPAVWYEMVQHTADGFRIGISMPGVPGLIMGRTRDVSFGFTYGFMDMIDYFIEEVQDLRSRRGEDFEPLSCRTEIILRKKKRPVTLKVWETRHGVLEVPPEDDRPRNGYHLCRAWSGHREGQARGFEALCKTLQAKTVPELQEILPDVTISGNWLLADTEGNIGYQQSGRLPLRQHSGLHPVPGWDESYDWRGFASADQLGRILNPPAGYIATANDDRNQAGKPLSINLPMGSYRFDRISAVLETKDDLRVPDMQALQRDLYSMQAERFMKLFRPLIPEGPTGDLLKTWDYHYDRESRAASLFEEIYHELLSAVFANGLFGTRAWRVITAETAIIVDFYQCFDTVLLEGDAGFFGEAGRAGIFRDVIGRVLGRYPSVEAVPTWGSQRGVMMTHLLFDGSLPRFLGFDYGPIVLEGNRATVVQGAIYRSHGRSTTFAPSYRFVTDLSETTAYTALAGGASDRRFSRYYLSDLLRWQRYEYKVLDGLGTPCHEAGAR